MSERERAGEGQRERERGRESGRERGGGRRDFVRAGFLSVFFKLFMKSNFSRSVSYHPCIFLKIFSKILMFCFD